jgi:hypothetical protein
MFTIKHLDKILAEIGDKSPKSIFSYKKNPIAYKLSRIEDNRKRGHVVERLVRDIFLSQNKKVQYIGGKHSFDMMVDNCRVEIKSSLASASVVGGMVRYSYQFQNIKTQNFDKLILVFISPEGLVMRQMSSKMADKYLANAKTYKNGKTLAIGKFCSKSVGKVLAA